MGNVTRLVGNDGKDGEVYVLVTQDRDRASMACEQIRGLCELIHLYRDRAGFSVENSNALLSGLNLIERLAGEVEVIIDGAPAVGGPQ